MKIFDTSIRFTLLLLTSILLQFLQGCGDLDVGSMAQMTKKSVVEITPEKEFSQMKRDAEAGDTEAQFILGSLYFTGIEMSKDTPKAVQWLQKAAEQEHVYAQDLLGIIYQFGDEKVPKDAKKAVKWLQKAAEQGHAMAQTDLGAIYRKGEDVPKNVVKAVEWWQKAAANGIAKAQFNLGLLYASGDETPPDPARAYAWLSLASVQINDEATALLIKIAGKMTSTQIAEGQRLASDWKKGDTLQLTSKSVLVKTENDGLTKHRTGTAFIVSHEGHILTNRHAINACKEVRVVWPKGVAKVITSDSVNDLALLQFSSMSWAQPDSFKINPTNLQQGKHVFVFGYPSFTSDAKLTPGTLSALTGLGNSTNQIQITAPVQSSSSGSPVLDKKGNVIGIILDYRRIMKITGQNSHNINFAVNGQTIKAFLDTDKVPYKTGGGFFSFFSREKNNAKISRQARKRTVIVECWK